MILMLRRPRSIILAGAALAATLVLFPGLAAAAPGPVRVSRASPYASCSTPPNGGEAQVNAEAEPMVARDPSHPMHLVGAWQQDRWTNGGSNGLMAGASFDGGRTWERATLPFDRCAPGGLDYDRASDPWVSIGPDGVAYAVSISATDFPGGPNAVGAATSTDGGRTWGRLRTIKSDPAAGQFNDKESVTADPALAGVAYAVWDRSRPRSVATMFSKTTDGGHHWSTPRAIAATGDGEQSLGNVIVVDPAIHMLYDFYALYSSVPTRIQFVTSTDGGTHWSPPHTVGRLDSLGVSNPNTGQPLRVGGDAFPSVTIGPSGTLYVAWQSRRFGSHEVDEIAITRSTDHGSTWAPVSRASTHTGSPAFTPTLTVTAADVVGLTYYDFRTLAPDNVTTLPTDHWLRTSTDGIHWTVDQHVAGPFNARAAPKAGGALFLGDYQGLTSVGSRFVPFFVKTNCATGHCDANRTDVFAARLPSTPTAP
jgi:hypothetical protein